MTEHPDVIKRTSFAIRADAMFDGFAMYGPATVYVADGKVTAVDRTGGPAAAGWETVDLGPESCLLPGLIDCHVHLAFDAGDDPVSSLRAADDAHLMEQMRAAAQRAVRAGITTVRDLGDRNYLAVALAREVRDEPGLGPQIIAAGPPITTPGGHCFFLGGEAEGAGALRAAVKERHARGCGVVKVMLSGGYMTPGSRPPYESQYSLEDLRVIVDEAHRAALPVAAHAHGAMAIRDAVTAGVDTIEHVSFTTPDGTDLSPELIAAAAGGRTVPSLSLGTDPTVPAPQFPPAMRQRLQGLRTAHSELVRHGTAVIGTDAGIAPFKPHDVLPYGIIHLAELGGSPLDALTAATSRAATACGLNGQKGRIAAGADADFLAVTGNPLEDLGRLRDVRAVFQSGTQIR